MLNEKQIIQKRKELLKKRRKIRIYKKPKTFKVIKLNEKNRISLIELDVKIAILDEIIKGNKIAYKPLKSIKRVKSILEEMKQIRPMVIHLLKTEPDTRDDDNLLCVRIWENQGVIPNMKMQTFKKRLIIKQYAQCDSITRCRRSLQERYKTLRGKLYDKRHQAEQEFKSQYKMDL
jgi:hypothetical protein